jgi:hypothetical protein
MQQRIDTIEEQQRMSIEQSQNLKSETEFDARSEILEDLESENKSVMNQDISAISENSNLHHSATDNDESEIDIPKQSTQKTLDKSYIRHMVQSDINNQEIEMITQEKHIEHQKLVEMRNIDKQAEIEKLRLQEELDHIHRQRVREEARIRQEALRLEELR